LTTSLQGVGVPQRPWQARWEFSGPSRSGDADVAHTNNRRHPRAYLCRAAPGSTGAINANRNETPHPKHRLVAERHALLDERFWSGLAQHHAAAQPAGATQIANVFFLNESDGWALLRTSHPPITNGVVFGDWGFELAYTDNGDASWTETPVQLPGLGKWEELGGDGTIDFVDPSHGWIDLSLVSSAAFNSGVLFSTSDGGETWQRVRSAPMIAASIKFVTLKEGWMAGGGSLRHGYQPARRRGRDDPYPARSGARSNHPAGQRANRRKQGRGLCGRRMGPGRFWCRIPD